jgi:arylesterase/paraoxonase
MKRFLVILVLVIGFFLVKTFYQAGQFKTIDNHFNGTVTNTYRNMPGPEDMQLDYFSGNLFISAATRRPTKNNNQNSRDGIYLLNIQDDQIPNLVPNNYPGEFHPHGISLLRIDSALYVFAVNHNDKGDFVESFRYNNGSLVHLASYSSPKMCCPNDLIATDINKFYVTNDHGSKKGLMRIIEDYLRVPRSTLLYFDGESFARAAGPFNYANGVNMSNDRKRLYLATTTGNSIISFDVNDDGTVTRKNTTDLATGVDNIDVDEDGNLWIAAHPKLLDFVKHAKDSTVYSPSQVFKLTPEDNYNFTVEEIYLNDGSEISAASIAVFYKDELFVGVVLDYSMLRATLVQ